MSKKSPLIFDTSPNEIAQDVTKKIDVVVPRQYISVSLPSLGRLNYPKVLHFRDYTMDDVLSLNVLDEEEQIAALIDVLNKMNFESYDIKKLHIKDVMQCLYTIQATFISNKMEKKYHINEELPKGTNEGCLDHESNINTVEIILSKLKYKTIDEGHKELKFKEPFYLQDPITKIKVGFKLSRIYDILFATEYCKTFFADELLTHKTIKKQIKRISAIEDVDERLKALEQAMEEDPDAYETYEEFTTKYETQYLRVFQASLIESVDGKVFNTIEEKLEAYQNSVSTSIWKRYNQVVEEYDFGILNDYTFYCERNQKNITRRFSFRYFDFLPNSEGLSSTRFNLSFD